MNIALFNNTKPWVQLLFTVFVATVCFLVFFLISNLITGAIYGFSTNLGDIGRLKLTQSILSIGLFLVPAIISAKLFAISAKKYLGLTQKPKVLQIISILFLVIMLMAISDFLLEINKSIELPAALQKAWLEYRKDAQDLVFKFILHNKGTASLLINIFVIAMIPALGEELMFRGVLQRIMLKFSPKGHLAVWLTAILFSAVHFDFFGFLPRMFLGLTLGYLMLYTGNLWLSIIAHFINNSIGVLGYHFFTDEIKAMEASQVPISMEEFIWVLMLLLVSFITFRNIVKQSE